MESAIPAVKRRSQCVRWLSGQCRYGPDCPCRLAQEADEAATRAANVVPPVRPAS
jgi:hypothetical protein